MLLRPVVQVHSFNPGCMLNMDDLDLATPESRCTHYARRWCCWCHGMLHVEQKTPLDAKDFCKRKVIMLKENMEKLHSVSRKILGTIFQVSSTVEPGREHVCTTSLHSRKWAHDPWSFCIYLKLLFNVNVSGMRIWVVRQSDAPNLPYNYRF